MLLMVLTVLLIVYLHKHRMIDVDDTCPDLTFPIFSAAHADLEAQRHREQSIASRLSNIGRSVPGLNSLMTRIRGRRERDRLILAGCIGTCITLIILYSLR